MTQSTGYGPRSRLPIFDGDEARYDLWEVKFLGYVTLTYLLCVPLYVTLPPVSLYIPLIVTLH